MATAVPLRKILEGMDWQSDEMTAYLNRKTGEVVAVSDEHVEVVETGDDLGDRAEWEAEAIEIARAVLTGQDYIALPDRFEIDEYRMMERFAYSVTDAAHSDRLQRAIRGKGAFRFFKDVVHDLGLADAWYAYRDESHEQIAVEWCDANGIVYTRGASIGSADA